jgi:L-ascorbate metabolism protein UlaG (beta-lactamase superfamily)
MSSMSSSELLKARRLRRERTLQSPRFHNDRFHNSEPTESPIKKAKRSGLSTTSEYFFSEALKRPPAPLPVESPLETWERSAETGLRVTWLGHSTTLLEIDGYRILTDPVWSDRISPVPFVGPRRFHAAPVRMDALPKLDAVLISHDHYDHLDYPSVREIARVQRDVTFYTSLGVGDRLEGLGISPSRIVELDWWEEALIGGGDLAITATPSRHFSGRSLFDRNVTLWSSWVLETSKHRVFFSGDTGLTNEFSTIRDRKGPFDLVMLEVGAFHPSWSDIHLGPDNALVAHRMLGGNVLLPVHWGTFDLALHAWDEPIETLATRAQEIGTQVVTPRLGRAIEPSQIERIDPWWREVALAPPIASPTKTSLAGTDGRAGRVSSSIFRAELRQRLR